VLAAKDSDEAIAYKNEYFAGKSIVSTKRCYETADYSNASAPTVETLLVTYTYYEDTGNMHLKTIADGTIYEYSNEKWNGKDYGKLTKETRPDKTCKLFKDYYDNTNQAKYIEEYGNEDFIKDAKYEKYTYDDEGNLTEKIYYFDGISIDPDVVESGEADNKWHKLSDFTEVLGDGNIHTQRDEIYADVDLITFEELNILSYYATGKLNVKDIYDNVEAQYSYSFQRYVFDTDGVTFLEIAGYYDLRWHFESDFTSVLGDGEIHAQRDEVYTDGPLTFDQLHILSYYATGILHVKEIYDNLDAIKNAAYREYIYNADGQLVSGTGADYTYYAASERVETKTLKIADGDDAAGTVYTYTNEIIHTYGDMTFGYLAEKYIPGAISAEDFWTTFTDYYPDKVEGKDIAGYVRIYDNNTFTKNTKYEEYAYDAAGNLTDKTYYFDGTSIDPAVKETGDPDNKWHKSSDFTEVLGDGYVHAQRDEVYNDAGLVDPFMVVVYDYYATGKVKTKEIYNNVDLTKDAEYEKYTYDATGKLTEKVFYYDGASIDPMATESGEADNKWHKSSDFTAVLGDGFIHAQRDAVYNDAALTDLVVESVYDYYVSGNIECKISSNSEAVVYHDSTGGEIETIWNIDGTITHWETVDDYVAKKIAWYKDSKYVETYTYYDSGRVQYKNQYKNVNGVWYWYRAGAYTDSGDIPFGDWDGGRARAVTGASVIFSLPDKPETTKLDSLKLTGMILPENTQDMENFYEKLEELKNSSDGTGSVVALLDSGIDRDALDIDILDGYDFAGENCFDGLTDSDYSDSIGHGTSVAGVVKGPDGEGLAPEADILAMKVFDDNAETTSGIVSTAICYAVDKGAKIIAMPFSLFPVSTALENAIDYAYSKGAVLLAAAGNSGGRILENSLAAQEKVITIGSCDADGNVSSWSNTGSELDLLAPWDVVTFSNGDKKEAGTSFSVAFVAGITALILSENPDITQEEVLEELKLFTKDIVPEKNIKTNSDRPRGVNVDEVVSMQNALRMNRAQFTGHSIIEDIPDVGIKK